MNVTRVQDDTGTHIEPALDSTWSEARKFEWHAAVVAHDTGLTIRVHPPGTDRLGRVVHGITIGEINKGGQTTIPALPFYDAWEFLSAVSIGAMALLALQQHAEGG